MWYNVFAKTHEYPLLWVTAPISLPTCVLADFHGLVKDRRFSLLGVRQMYRRSSSYRNKWETLCDIFGNICVYCHVMPATTIDHVMPVSYRECHDLDNLRPACFWCNVFAGSRKFDNFNDKYWWMQKHLSGKIQRKIIVNRTTCATCWLPYQRPYHTQNMFLCPECYDLEYEAHLSDRTRWRDWLLVLEIARINVDGHREFGNFCRTMHGLTAKEKADVFGTIQASYLSELAVKPVFLTAEDERALARYSTVKLLHPPHATR